MQALKYIVEDKVLAEVLGRQNFANKESAILELVKNAYDAGATTVGIVFEQTEQGVCLNIVDNGCGMNQIDIEKAWMHVGKSYKGYKDENTGRVLSGSMGIGRFALSRLGETVELISKKENELGICWKTNWESSYLLDMQEINETSPINRQGTHIKIFALREKWTRRSIKPLAEYFSKIYRSDSMKITIKFDQHAEEMVVPIWRNPQIGNHYVANIHFDYSSNKQKLIGEIVSDEFKEVVSSIVPKDINIKKSPIEINVFEELKKEIGKMLEQQEENEITKNISEEEILLILKQVGDFSSHFYFSLSSSTKKDFERFEYKYKILPERYEYGTILYRNAFGIDSFEGRRDWLDMGSRARKSPAAATHPTGSWRVRTNQISGYVMIDKLENPYIEDMSNRQGIVENIHYTVFKEIISLGIREFERHRQSIIRPIDSYKRDLERKALSKSDEESKATEQLLKRLQEDPSEINKLSDKETKQVVTLLFTQEKEKEYYKKEKETAEEKARYDVQLLNVLATSHLKIVSLSHEIHNNRNNTSVIPEYIEDSLKSLELWEEVSDEALPKHKNIPGLLKDMKISTKRFLNLADTILEETEKKNFEVRNYKFNELVSAILKKWKRQYNWLQFDWNINGQDNILVSFDQIAVILDNLILNSVQQNENNSNLKIQIRFDIVDDIVSFSYEDNGKGLGVKYRNNPWKILEVHESTRKSGHGLGMWIVNNTIMKMDGKIEYIEPQGLFILRGHFKVAKGDNYE